MRNLKEVFWQCPSRVFAHYSSSRTHFWCQKTWGLWPSNGEVSILTTSPHTPGLPTHPYGVQMARWAAFFPTSALWFQLWPLVAGTLAGCEPRNGHLSCKKLQGFGNPRPIQQLRLHRCSCQLKGNNPGGITWLNLYWLLSNLGWSESRSGLRISTHVPLNH